MGVGLTARLNTRSVPLVSNHNKPGVIMLVNISSVAAQFLTVDEVIERGGHMMRVVGRPLADLSAMNRVRIVVVDLETEGEPMSAVSLPVGLMVATYDEIS